MLIYLACDAYQQKVHLCVGRCFLLVGAFCTKKVDISRKERLASGACEDVTSETVTLLTKTGS